MAVKIDAVLGVGDMSGSFLKGFSTHAAANWAGVVKLPWAGTG